MNINSVKIAVIGLGYVGLPLAVEFGKKFDIVGFDIKPERIKELASGIDETLEVEEQELKSASRLTFSSNPEDLSSCNFYIVTVPTPIDEHKQPNLTPLQKASQMLGKVISKGDIIVYESTVYPGATEESCLPIVEQISGLTYNEDFYAGYSPERINPGDKSHRLPDIKKVTSGSTPEVADFIDSLYAEIIKAGTYKASSIRVAEAAKVIENTQRDLNIALVNELSMIFHRLGIDTLEVLEAAGTKWNFLPFRPGLVGGHCIGVDPYYLTHKAQSTGYNPEIILAGRRLNDNMPKHVASEIIKLMINAGSPIKSANVLVLGCTFKENCPDIRNSKVFDLINELESYATSVDVYDPWANSSEVIEEYDTITYQEQAKLKTSYDAIVLAVAHEELKSFDFKNFSTHQTIVYDLKSVLPKDQVNARL
ncbi:MAG: Vi polysaccharide biosynthesis UDP-N-acetylglucosamine C-6 dehydrogenase TviB [Lentisphaeria bacterium]|nr:Vi polysaccharide biosynthesis UDP-N-acetylglucosamine C-6 dehydrogenase TviB [Lentisphaeria bacterium]